MDFADSMLIVSLIFLGVILGPVVVLILKAFITEFLNKMKNEAAFARKIVTTVVVVALVVVLFSAVRKGSALNTEMREFMDRPVDVHLQYHINEMDERMDEAGVLARLFIRNKDEYVARKQENDAFIDAAAAELAEAIDGLEPFGALKSVEQIAQIQENIAAVKIDHDKYIANTSREYYDELELRTANYAEFLAYEEAFEKKLDACREKCSNCRGDGWRSSSGGTCSSCGGSGRKSVKWYSQGDWGTTSYTSYECTSCDGSGRISGSRTRCSSCTDGYVYNFE